MNINKLEQIKKKIMETIFVSILFTTHDHPALEFFRESIEII